MQQSRARAEEPVVGAREQGDEAPSYRSGRPADRLTG